MKTEADLMLRKAFSAYKKKNRKIGVSEIARACDLPYTSVYNTLYSRRKCNAQIWLKIMKYLGAVEIKEDEKVIMNSHEIFSRQSLSQCAQF